MTTPLPPNLPPDNPESPQPQAASGTGSVLPSDPARWLDWYLDDLLTDSQRATFEAELARNASIREQLLQQRAIDLAIRGGLMADVSTFNIAGKSAPQSRVASLGGREVAAASPLPTRPRSSVVARIGRRPNWMKRAAIYAVAAAVLLGAGVFSFIYTREGPKRISPEELFARMQATGFVPAFKCTTDEEFTAAVSRRLGQGMLVTHTPDVELLGWAYGNSYEGEVIGAKTLILMCKLDDQHHVLVLMDQKAADRTLELAKDSKLRLFRRELGSLVLYELTPLRDQRVIGLAHIPECGDIILKPGQTPPGEPASEQPPGK